MKKLQLFKALDQPIDSKNANALMSAFASDTFDPAHASARFSNTAVMKQTGYFQRINGIVYIYIELCPDINNPLGGGATVSFTSGDLLQAPFLSLDPQTYTSYDLVGHQPLTLVNMATGTRYDICRIQTNATTGLPEIYIGHTIAATAATFCLTDFYIVRT